MPSGEPETVSTHAPLQGPTTTGGAFGTWRLWSLPLQVSGTGFESVALEPYPQVPVNSLPFELSLKTKRPEPVLALPQGHDCVQVPVSTPLWLVPLTWPLQKE